MSRSGLVGFFFVYLFLFFFGHSVSMCTVSLSPRVSLSVQSCAPTPEAH